MTQSVDEVFSMFFDKLERDDDFFSYYDVSEEEAMELARERANSYLKEAIVYLKRQMALDFNLETETIMNEDGYDQTTFVEGVNDMEVDLLTEIMLLRYYERDLAKLKAKINFLSSSDLTVLHSPANERTSYVQMLEKIKENVTVLMSQYQAIDRKTGKRKSVINPSDYMVDAGVLM